MWKSSLYYYKATMLNFSVLDQTKIQNHLMREGDKKNMYKEKH